MPKMNTGYTYVPRSVLRSTQLSASSKALYSVLLTYAGSKDHCWPSQATLSSDLCASTRSVIRWMKALSAAGLVTVRRRGLTRTNVYRIAPVDGTESHFRASSGSEDSPPVLEVPHRHTNLKQGKQESINKGDDPDVASLTASGITESVATRLLAEYGSDQCHRQLRWIDHRKARSKSAVLVQAIRGNWSAPSAFEKAKPRASVGDTSSASLGAIMGQLAKNGAPGSEFMERLGQQAGPNCSSRAQPTQN